MTGKANINPEGYPDKDSPFIIDRAKHPISRKNIDGNALKILYRLRNSGFTAYLAGGAVRDMLLGEQPADFDIVTDASPKQLKRLFRNSRIIGRRFRLVHVFFHGRSQNAGQIFEVATFRRPFTEEENEQKLIQEKPELANNLFGSPAEDARRRDFTINALFYNIADFSVIDHVNGLRDLQEKTIRIIGDPEIRFAEDPVRILRALEFACRLKFSIEENTAFGLRTLAPSLAEVPASRLREELKGLYTKKTTSALLALGADYAVNQHWLPPQVAAQVAVALPLLRRAESFFPANDNESFLEKIILSILVLPVVLDLYPLTAEARLNLVAAKVEETLESLNQAFNLPRFQRHAVKETIGLLYRLGRGDKRINQLLKREHFFSALFLFAACRLNGSVCPDHTSFWRQQSGRLNQHSGAMGLDYEKLFSDDF
ncbi:MAG TPA: polynucleotide adenylyltransferase PcnB [Proteobacteria bacterium]|nr:polynucleotide adenylyltransferase PcnB [Pseudomonadota bacterium]